MMTELEAKLDRQEAWREAAAAAGQGVGPEGSIQSDRRKFCIMPVAGGGFDQCYPQAAVAAGHLLVVATDVVQSPNDKQQVEPMLVKIEALPDELGQVDNLLAGQRLFQCPPMWKPAKRPVEPMNCAGSIKCAVSGACDPGVEYLLAAQQSRRSSPRIAIYKRYTSV